MIFLNLKLEQLGQVVVHLGYQEHASHHIQERPEGEDSVNVGCSNWDHDSSHNNLKHHKSFGNKVDVIAQVNNNLLVQRPNQCHREEEGHYD